MYLSGWVSDTQVVRSASLQDLCWRLRLLFAYFNLLDNFSGAHWETWVLRYEEPFL